MKRLTDESGICVDCDGIAHCRRDCRQKQIYDRLKYFEDLLEQKKLVMLPCGMDTLVYRVYADDCGNQPCMGNCWTCKDAYWKINEVKFKDCFASNYGTSVFLTYEEAENAVEKLKQQIKEDF